MPMGLPANPVVTVLIQEAPSIEIIGDLVFVTDSVNGQPAIRRAMPRSVAVQVFSGFAAALRKDRAEKGAEILPFRTEFVESA